MIRLQIRIAACDKLNTQVLVSFGKWRRTEYHAMLAMQLFAYPCYLNSELASGQTTQYGMCLNRLGYYA